MIAIGTTDLIFALDSIPAIFGLTKEPYLVFTANVFALMGLRQLYFLLGGLLDRLIYLNVGLAVVLGFIGVKLILEALPATTCRSSTAASRSRWAPHDPDLAVADRHRRHAGRGHRGQPDQVRPGPRGKPTRADRERRLSVRGTPPVDRATGRAPGGPARVGGRDAVRADQGGARSAGTAPRTTRRWT